MILELEPHLSPWGLVADLMTGSSLAENMATSPTGAAPSGVLHTGSFRLVLDPGTGIIFSLIYLQMREIESSFYHPASCGLHLGGEGFECGRFLLEEDRV